MSKKTTYEELRQRVKASEEKVSGRKRAEQALREKEAELENMTRSLAEMNTAMEVLLQKRDKDKKELEEKVLLNIQKLVMPCIEKLKKSGLDDRQISYTRILESNLKEIISPFSSELSSKHLKLTPAEVQVSDLIRQGKTSKEIADLFGLSSKTIESHRKNIRRKIGINNKKENLRIHLSYI